NYGRSTLSLWGWSKDSNESRRSDHPVCAASVASQHWFEWRSHPPPRALRGGECAAYRARRAKATRAVFAPEPVATTTNCRPDFVLYVMGVALTGNGVGTRDSSRPVVLSKAYR